MDIDWCKGCDSGLIAPDAIIYLDMPVDEAALRGHYGEERYEKIDFQIQVREQFLLLKQQDDRKSCNGSDDVVKWHVIDAGIFLMMA